MTEKRVHELAPLVRQSASELSDLWALRVRVGANGRSLDVVRAA
jgi:hypothetical protein